MHDHVPNDRFPRLTQLKQSLQNKLFKNLRPQDNPAHHAQGRLGSDLLKSNINRSNINNNASNNKHENRNHTTCMSSSTSQITLLREFTHDWLHFHSTQTPCRRCKIIERVIRQLAHTPPFLGKLSPYSAGPNPLLTLLNQCQIQQNFDTIQLLLRTYLDAQKEVETKERQSAVLFRSKRLSISARLPLHWFKRTNAMVLKPKKKRLYRTWFSRKRPQINELNSHTIPTKQFAEDLRHDNPNNPIIIQTNKGSHQERF